MAKNPGRHPKILKPAQGYANLGKAMQASPLGEGERSRARCAYLHLSQKKIVYFCGLAAGAFIALA
jgi:hypothetical protein